MASTQTVTTLPPAMEPQLDNHDSIRLERMSRSANDNQALDTRNPEENVSPDNDWDNKEGWPVVAAGAAIFFVYLGLIYSYGIVQLHLTEARLASVSTLSFIGSVGAALTPLTGMIVAQIIKRIGYSATAFIGGLFLGLGEFTAGWSTKSVPAMFATQGFLFGVGASLLFLVKKTLGHIFDPCTISDADLVGSRPLQFRPCGSRGNEGWRPVSSMAALAWVLL